MFRSPLLATMTILSAFLAAARADDARRPLTMAGRSTVYAPHGVVATSQPLASAAGLGVLQKGGNAVDAAVTAAAVLNVTEPMMTGIGGDMFAIVWVAKEKRLVGLNGSGRAGARATREELAKRGRKEMPGHGVETITVPGALAGWSELLAKYGTITLAQALEPAIQIAEEGFPVTPVIAGDWAGGQSLLEEDAEAARLYLGAAKRAPKAGEWFKNPDIAASFKQIAKEGPGALYGGALGQRIVTHLESKGGFLTLDDLKSHRSEWVTPMSVPFKGYRLYELPPNGQGIAALEILRILEPYDLKAMGQNTPVYLHHLIEARKLAFADLRRFIGEPAAMKTPAAHLLTDAFIAERRSRLDVKHAALRPEPGPAATASETIYLTAADRDGNMVSFINSLYDAFGSGIVVPGTGFALQNRGAAFTMDEGVPNTIAPGKRPFHTIIPAFVTKTAAGGEEPFMSYGVMGGDMQTQGHVQVLLNLLVFGMDLQQALDAPRFRHLRGNGVGLEAPFTNAVRSELTSMGHDVSELPAGDAGGAQAIVRLPRGWAAASDPRKDGMAVGY
jgi:gamma-glutamyltranspeptidase / glutathione hydrolase